MKKNSIFIFILAFIVSCGTDKSGTKKETEVEKAPNKDSVITNEKIIKTTNDSNFVSGDLIFQTSLGEQSELISIATQSPFTHCGIIILENEMYYVLEASGTVTKTPMEEWKNRGKEGKFIVMRLKNPTQFQSEANSKKAYAAIKNMMGKKYDSQFSWTDEKIYCSELLWKLFYESTGVEICPKKQFKDFDLTDPKVKKELEKRYGKNIPLEEAIVSPADIVASDYLEMIYSNY